MLSQSGLSYKQIREIWACADRDGRGQVAQMELAAILRLAGWVQAGRDVRESLLGKGPLPTIKGISDKYPPIPKPVTIVLPPVTADVLEGLKEYFLECVPVSGALEKREVMAVYMQCKPDLSLEALYRVMQLVDPKNDMCDFRGFATGLHVVQNLDNATLCSSDLPDLVKSCKGLAHISDTTEIYQSSTTGNSESRKAPTAAVLNTPSPRSMSGAGPNANIPHPRASNEPLVDVKLRPSVDLLQQIREDLSLVTSQLQTAVRGQAQHISEVDKTVLSLTQENAQLKQECYMLRAQLANKDTEYLNMVKFLNEHMTTLQSTVDAIMGSQEATYESEGPTRRDVNDVPFVTEYSPTNQPFKNDRKGPANQDSRISIVALTDETQLGKIKNSRYWPPVTDPDIETANPQIYMPHQPNKPPPSLPLLLDGNAPTRPRFGPRLKSNTTSPQLHLHGLDRLNHSKTPEKDEDNEGPSQIAMVSLGSNGHTQSTQPNAAVLPALNSLSNPDYVTKKFMTSPLDPSLPYIPQSDKDMESIRLHVQHKGNIDLYGIEMSERCSSKNGLDVSVQSPMDSSFFQQHVSTSLESTSHSVPDNHPPVSSDIPVSSGVSTPPISEFVSSWHGKEALRFFVFVLRKFRGLDFPFSPPSPISDRCIQSCNSPVLVVP
ncbi:putative calcium-binding protein [Psilocybe cubensis]|uniref:Calcium-binding protein n=1 Tax=Psilocybe cubensis TaxID=181762 RepID=A0ACB8GKW3_PSICU|nr:putative calcium-binding protein [Psilocybe cubensis]KAH9476229.1 putative calcium-binding protein [Psilocybe cubensis]